MSTPTQNDTRSADLATRWLVVLLVAPVIIIAVGYLVSLPINMVLELVNFDPERHPVIALLTRVVIGILWAAGSALLIRLAWPGARGPSDKDA